MKVEVPYEPTTYFKRKTNYNNHNQISIVGNGQTNGFPPSGTAIDDSLSPNNNSSFNKNGTGRDFNRVLKEDEGEENIMFLNNPGGQAGNRRSDLSGNNNNFGIMSGSTAMRETQEESFNDPKNQQINELSDMVKLLLNEQRSLKDKIEMQEMKMLRPDNLNKESIEVNNLIRKQREITKKASERTRSQNPPKKSTQSADSKTLHARKLRE